MWHLEQRMKQEAIEVNGPFSKYIKMCCILGWVLYAEVWLKEIKLMSSQYRYFIIYLYKYEIIIPEKPK